MVDAKLDSYLANYTKFNDWLIQRRYEHLSQYFAGKCCLELGSAEGSGTPYLLDSFDEVTIVDGSKDALRSVAKKLASPKLTAVHSYFEDLDLNGRNSIRLFWRISLNMLMIQWLHYELRRRS